MLARRRIVRLKNGVELQTPALVPALSSVATAPILHASAKSRKPELTPCSLVHSEMLSYGLDDAVVLISAYDIANNLLTDAESLRSGFLNSSWSRPRFLIVDSGWYEKEGSPQGGVFAEGMTPPLPWEEADYENTLGGLDPELQAAIVTWDCAAGSYAEQIGRGQAFFSRWPRFSSIALLKPPSDSRFHRLDGMTGDDISNLRAFEVVGVTEKELGETVLDRLVALGQLRRRMDEHDVSAPIHVFGGLDPLFTPLLFAAGGEIFDGLSWLRYAYHQGQAIHRESAALLNQQVDDRWSLVMGRVQIANLTALRELDGELALFVHHKGDWSRFRQGSVLEPVYDRFQAKLGRA